MLPSPVNWLSFIVDIPAAFICTTSIAALVGGAVENVIVLPDTV